MFHATIDMKVACPHHPDFDPAVGIPDRKCRYCQTINNVRDWIRLAQRAATRVAVGEVLKAEEPEDASAAQPQEIAHVITDTTIPREEEKPTPVSGKKRGVNVTAVPVSLLSD